ncbi:RHS repeat-associated core domain-containing protein [Streptomyces sp. NPDC094448]|uniref:RHS repeat-associated core domain-containing protein n=1 Tax=Streptomyces sp. NPDC094448 TaxID=3366063 RepID=UPI0037F93E99
MAVTVPDWADTLLDLIGVNWPNVDEDAYRDMAASLRSFQEDILDDGQIANRHVQRLLSSGEGEAMTALNQHWDKVKGKHLKDLATAAGLIAEALEKAATAIEAMKYVAIGHLGALAAKAGISMALIPVTGGLSGLLGAGAIAACQQLVRKAIKECMNEVVSYIVGAMTAPAVAALESMAADLVVQAGSAALGLQDGVSPEQTAQAGKDSLNLNSAGGGGRGGDRGKVDHAEHERAGNDLNLVSVRVNGRTTSRLDKARSHHGRTRGRDDIAQALDPVVDKAMEALTKATSTMGNHLGTTLPENVRRISRINKGVDVDTRDSVNKGRKVQGDGGDISGTTPPGSGNTRKGPADTRTQPASLDGAKSDPRGNSIPPELRECEGDPVDVASGQMLLPQTDLTLPGTLPLVLRRVHLSGYHHGHWFGRSWASTLDERIEFDSRGLGALWAREDGTVLIYPALPAPGDPTGVLPLEGDRLALTHGGTDESGAETAYTVTDPRTGLVRTFTGSPYHPSTAFWLTRIEDRHGNGVTFHRGPDGAPDRIVHDGGYRIAVTVRDARVDRIALRTPDGPVTVMSYGYDGDGNLDAVTNSSNLPLRFTYDTEARIISWTDRNESTFHYVYDTAGRVMRTVGPDGHLSGVFAYDTAGRTTSYTDSTGATKVFRFDDRLRVVAETDALGHTELRSYGPGDRVVSRTDRLGHTTEYDHDDRGNLVAVRHPDGTAAAVTYDDHGRLTSVTDGEGAVWRQEYDASGNPTVFTHPDGTTTRTGHDAHGRLTALDDSLGTLDRVRHDAAGLPEAVRGPGGTVTRYERDPFGRPVRITGPDGGTTVLEWTVEGLPARRTEPDGTEQSWTYDGEGNCLSHTDALGGTTYFTYTHFDLLKTRTGPDGDRHTFGYDTELRLTRVTNARGMSWTYGYDPAGRLTAETDFDGRTLAYTHDATGRLTSRTNGAGQTVRYERDRTGRLITKDVEGAVTRFGYDARGLLTHATGPGFDLQYTYDTTGRRLLRELCNGRELTFHYDAGGRRVHRTTPSGATSDWTYPGGTAELDASGHRIVFGFDPAGRRSTRRHGDRLTVDQSYDGLGRLTAQHVRTGPEADRTVQRRAYTYREDGALTAVTDLLDGDRAYALTPTGRVTAVTAEGWTERYAYDDLGNQTEARTPAAPDTNGPRGYAGTRINRAGTIRYEYDTQGRVVRRRRTRLSRKPDNWHYTWDAEDRLTQVTTPDGTRWRYTYDPHGRRIAKERLAAEGDHAVERTDFTWDGDVLCEEASGSTSSPGITTVLTWDHDGLHPVSQTERRLRADAPQEEIDHRFFAVVTDLVGAPRELVDEQGDVAWRARTTLWGTTGWHPGATAYTPLRFPGQYFDPETGLHYNRHRHYDPASGHYLTPDPLGLLPSPNAYAYVGNPTGEIDPLGLAAEPGTGCPTRDKGGRHSVVLGVDLGPNAGSDGLADHLRRNGDPGAHTYNGPEFSSLGSGNPHWMLNVGEAVYDRNGTTLSVTLDGMPITRDGKDVLGNWNTPETIVEAFVKAVEKGENFGLNNWPGSGSGTAWEMSVIARAVREYEGGIALGDTEEEARGRSWDSIRWYSENQEIKVPRPDIPHLGKFGPKSTAD